ncbi:MAG: isopeptide-forming domain-containing fimbrial protein [Eubacterium sp.]|nr:isopeptide-forming domain-containing fimbrial protein [Eubacterium sp.]
MNFRNNLKKSFHTLVAIMLAALMCFSVFVTNSQVFAEVEANVDVTLNAKTPEIKSGTTGVYELDVKIAGSQESIQEKFRGSAKLTVQLPVGEAIEYYDLQTRVEDLAISGVVPKYEEGARTLTYIFPNPETGISGKVHIGITTKNGIMPNDTKLTASAVLVDGGDMAAAQSADAVINVKSAYSQSISKEYMYVEKDHKLNAAHPGDDVVWRIKATVVLPATGGIYMKPGSDVVIEDKLDPRLTYVSSKSVSGDAIVATNNDNGTVRWTFKAPTLAKQQENEVLFTTELELVTKTSAAIDKYTKIPNAAKLSTINLFDSAEVKNSNASNAVVAPSDSPIAPSNGGYYPPIVKGPADGKGGIASAEKVNPNPAVVDTERLVFEENFRLALQAGEELTDGNGTSLNKSAWNVGNILKDGYKKYVTEYSFDNSKLNFGSMAIYVPCSNYISTEARDKLRIVPVTTLTVKLSDGTTKSKIVDFSDVDKTWGYVRVGRTDLGLKDADKVVSYSLSYENNDGSTIFGGVAFTTHSIFTIEKGAEGEAWWKPSFVVTMADGSVIRRTGGDTDTLTGKRTAVIVQKEVSDPVVRGTVAFVEKDGNVVKTGENKIQLMFNNFSTSRAELRKDIDATILLPLGVTVKGDGAAVYKFTSGRAMVAESKDITGTFKIIDNDYKGSGQQLVKVSWDKDGMLPGERLELTFDVNISDNSPEDLQIKAYGMSSTDTKLKTDAANVVIEKDADDINKSGDASQDRALWHSEYVRYSRDDLKIKKYVKGSLDSEYSTFGYATPGEDISYKLNMTNTTGKDIFKLGFIDVLPVVGDLGIVDGTARGSAFTPSLKGAIELPADWKDKVDVYYSTSNNPKRDSLYSKVKYPKGAYQHVNPVGSEDPAWTKDTASWTEEDWAKVRSFKLELKDGVTWVKGQDMTLTFTMKAPKEDDVDAAVLVEGMPKRSEEIEMKAAWNSFAVSTNGLLPTEPERVGVILSKVKGEPVEVAYYIEGTSTKLQPNKDLVKDQYVGTPYSVPKSAENDETLLPKTLKDKDGKVYELVSTNVKPNGDYPDVNDPNGNKVTVKTAPAEGKVTKEHQVINYDYAPKKGGEVVVKYVIEGTDEVLENPAVNEKDSDGNYIVKKKGTQVGTDYDTRNETFMPKKLVKNGKTYILTKRMVDPKTDPVNGKVTEEKQLVIYEYKLVNEPVPTPDKPNKPNQDKVKTSNAVNTGDVMNTEYYILCMALSMLLFVAVKRRSKSR